MKSFAGINKELQEIIMELIHSLICSHKNSSSHGLSCCRGGSRKMALETYWGGAGENGTPVTKGSLEGHP